MGLLYLRPVKGGSRTIKLDGDRVTIGRHPDNVVRIRHEKASRHHAVVEAAPELGEGLFRLRDLSSRNGTRLNGMRVTESALAVGDVIEVAGFEMVVEDRSGVAADGGSPKLSSVRRAREPGSSVDSAAWAADIRRVLKNFEGRGGADDMLKLVDASGRDSDALSGTGAGPLCLGLLLRAAGRTASTDVHVEPKGGGSHVRMRVDGVMVWITELPEEVADLVAGVVKTACQMPPSAKGALLDGHFSCRFSDRRVEYRVSFTPSVHGPKMVLRVLDQRGVPMAIEDLGMPALMREKIASVTRLDTGMLLACGPTGSGKTTTLYNCLREIDRDARNVITIEDPVEYQVGGVTQMPIDERTGATFYSMLRSVLRQDPDVILLGEIRDEDTARTAMQAAMTGHLVFSTVHARDTIASVFRLLDLKVEPYLVANSLSLVLAQRLVRRLCDACKAAAPLLPGQAVKMGRAAAGVSEHYTPVGCACCLDTGYRGRRGLFELLELTDDMRDVILSNPNIHDLKRLAREGLFTTLADFGWKLVAEGATSAAEVERVTGSA